MSFNASACVPTGFDASGGVTALSCDGVVYEAVADLISPTDARFWLFLGLSIALVLLAGLLSGLTIGLVALDVNTVQVLAKSGEPNEQRHAARILPLVRRHHLLLVTLLLANAVCTETLPIFIDQIASPVAAVAISVSAVIIFGEIIPQAVCTRYGLAIGANLAWFVWALIVLLSPLGWPIARLLDYVFGHAYVNYYRRNELSELIQLHGMRTHARPRAAAAAEGAGQALTRRSTLCGDAARDSVARSRGAARW